MSPHFPDEVSSPSEERAAAFSDIFFSRGWSRQLPPASIEIFGALVVNGASPRHVIEGHLRTIAYTADGWQSPCWEELHEWTDDELAKLRDDFGSSDEDEDAASVMAAEAAQRERQLAAIDSYSNALSVAPVRTMDDLFEFMVAARLIVGDGADEATYDINRAAPLPGEVLPLSDEEREAEDRLRWLHLHESTAQAIIGLFAPQSGDPQDRKRTSLERLARELRTDVESARAGVLNLLDEGDFSATIDVERAADHQVFELAVDWERFANGRIGVHVAAPGKADEERLSE